MRRPHLAARAPLLTLSSPAAALRCTGGLLPPDWQCGMRFRLTTRRNGNVGRTTDNVSRPPG